MYYAKIDNGNFVKRCNVADEVPDITFTEEPTAEQLAPYNVVIINDPATYPTFDPATQGLVDIDPTLGSDGKWYANYTVVDRAPDPEPPTPGIPG